MADKTIGELKRATSLDDDSLMIAEQQGEAVSVTGQLFRLFAQESTKVFAESASADAATAVGAKDAAQSALQGVRDALDNLPAGSTLIINDLTTGGTTAALSAEMGKKLNEEKFNKAGDIMTGALGIARGNNYTYLDIDDIGNSTYLRQVNGDRWAQILFNESVFNYAKTLDGGRNWATYDVLHTGNKPLGVYRGTGDPASYSQNLGAITSPGGALSIATGVGMFAFVFFEGALLINTTNNTIGTLPATEANYRNGVLTLATENAFVNAGAVDYFYQVL